MAMLRRTCGFLVLLGLAAAALYAALVPSRAAAQPAVQPATQTVSIVQIRGAIDAAYADYLVDEIRLAERKGTAAILLRLDSPGAIKADVGRLLDAVRNSRVPIAAWVGPKGASTRGVASALWHLADLRLVAPGAHVRSMSPAQPGGTGLDGLVGVTAQAPDGVAGTLAEAVRTLDGRTVNGTRLSVDAQQATIRFASPGLLTRARHSLATNPTLVYLLLVVGIGALVFEAFQRGFGPAGYVGALLLVLTGYGLSALPTNPIGLALVLLGLAALALDVWRNGLGVPTWGGAVTLAVGSVFLVHSHGPALRPHWSAIVVAVIGSLVFYVPVMTVVLRALRVQSAAMGQALLGQSGEVRSTLNPQGHVLIDGALWRARAIEWDGPVETGTRVTVTGVDESALILDVLPAAERG